MFEEFLWHLGPSVMILDHVAFQWIDDMIAPAERRHSQRFPEIHTAFNRQDLAPKPAILCLSQGT